MGLLHRITCLLLIALVPTLCSASSKHGSTDPKVPKRGPCSQVSKEAFLRDVTHFLQTKEVPTPKDLASILGVNKIEKERTVDLSCNGTSLTYFYRHHKKDRYLMIMAKETDRPSGLIMRDGPLTLPEVEESIAKLELPSDRITKTDLNYYIEIGRKKIFAFHYNGGAASIVHLFW